MKSLRNAILGLGLISLLGGCGKPDKEIEEPTIITYSFEVKKLKDENDITKIYCTDFGKGICYKKDHLLRYLNTDLK